MTIFKVIIDEPLSLTLLKVKGLEISNALFANLFGVGHYKVEEVAREGVKTSFFKTGPNKIELLEAEILKLKSNIL